ncbi:hypothetical protein ACVW00_001166 [Marmoricola sp. URHA0025 HA25]
MQQQDARVQVGRIRFRRAVALMVMTLVLPGSAQLVAGRREVGRVAMRIWFGLVAFGFLFLLVSVFSHTFAIWFFTSTFNLGLIRFALMALAVGWALLLVDAWRLGEPLALRQKQRLAMVGINGVLCFAVAGSLLYASHVVNVNKDVLAAVFGSSKVTGAHEGRFNILLLGGDSGADRWGLRPDSITVASIDEETGKTVLFGLPRNMLNFPFAKGSIMAQQFPRGYNCGTQCELNSLATWAADHKALFKGVANPGVEATKEAVEGITGLKVNYYAMVNLRGFQKMVDAVGGVTLDVRDRIPIGGVGGPGHGLHPARQAQAQRLPDALVRPLPRVRGRLLADGPAEVRDERDAPPAQPAEGGAEVREDREGQRGTDLHRRAAVRGRSVREPGAQGTQ